MIKTSLSKAKIITSGYRLFHSRYIQTQLSYYVVLATIPRIFLYIAVRRSRCNAQSDNTHIEKVCGEYGDATRTRALEQFYHGDGNWFQPHKYAKGRNNITTTSEEEEDQTPGFYLARDEEAVSQSLGIVQLNLASRQQSDMNDQDLPLPFI